MALCEAITYYVCITRMCRNLTNDTVHKRRRFRRGLRDGGRQNLRTTFEGVIKALHN